MKSIRLPPQAIARASGNEAAARLVSVRPGGNSTNSRAPSSNISVVASCHRTACATLLTKSRRTEAESRRGRPPRFPTQTYFGGRRKTPAFPRSSSPATGSRSRQCEGVSFAMQRLVTGAVAVCDEEGAGEDHDRHNRRKNDQP